MKPIINNLKNLIYGLADTTISVIKSLGKLDIKKFVLDYYQDFFSKIKDLKGTNWDLALYHLKAGNYNDAIMRFKLVGKTGYRQKEIYYFLALIYHEKDQILDSKHYLTLYLNSDDQNYRAEAEYLAALNGTAIINTIPQSILQLRRGRITFNLQKASFDKTTIERFLTIINLLKNTAPNCNRILELGCHIGFLGKLLKENLPVHYLKGKDWSKESLEVTKLLRDVKDNKIYNELELVNDFTELFNENALYNLVIIPEVLDAYSDLMELFMESLTLLDDNGLLIITFMQDDSNFHYSHSLDAGFNLVEMVDNQELTPSEKEFSFIKELEVFSFNPYYVKSLAEKIGFTLTVSLKSNGFTILLLSKCLKKSYQS
jgi:2-polyprenyl-3-methyl-5-hydroxy-6-metoxy-1,4-benzoquinol methylase